MNNIRNLENYRNSFWDWSFLNDCFFGTRIRVTDIDGAVERNGHVLFFETKPIDFIFDIESCRGQYLFYQALAMSGFCVFIIFGQPSEPEAIMTWLPYEIAPRERKDIDKEGMKRFVIKWFEWANRMPKKIRDARHWKD